SDTPHFTPPLSSISPRVGLNLTYFPPPRSVEHLCVSPEAIYSSLSQFAVVRYTLVDAVDFKIVSTKMPSYVHCWLNSMCSGSSTGASLRSLALPVSFGEPPCILEDSTFIF
ncbi:hypothetical protein AABB24_013910, partial [Solanum stoloniferum]